MELLVAIIILFFVFFSLCVCALERFLLRLSALCISGDPARKSRQSYCGEGRLFAQAYLVSFWVVLCCMVLETCVLSSS